MEKITDYFRRFAIQTLKIFTIISTFSAMIVLNFLSIANFKKDYISTILVYIFNISKNSDISSKLSDGSISISDIYRLTSNFKATEESIIVMIYMICITICAVTTIVLVTIGNNNALVTIVITAVTSIMHLIISIYLVFDVNRQFPSDIFTVSIFPFIAVFLSFIAVFFWQAYSFNATLEGMLTPKEEIFKTIDKLEENFLKIQSNNLMQNFMSASKKAKKNITKIYSIKCFKCGAKNSKNAKFCSICGINISKPICTGCGKVCAITDKFCNECGKSIK